MQSVLTGGSLCEPQVTRSSSMHEVETEKVPFASYTFHYRSTRKFLDHRQVVNSTDPISRRPQVPRRRAPWLSKQPQTPTSWLEVMALGKMTVSRAGNS